ncbi:hypothetical protein B0T11DRAFT_330913 [Plectosphaerella cucumerina]|uniref:CFEM domain-containing protein n=1 Tax=Plectosphaerella cucumerina TaxID=40658 RepID=A0A8K0X3W3_9PEZI|nr:hypothetical protein B0T11DRAFT_330913 [Plectosphaerella cucumerina]
MKHQYFLAPLLTLAPLTAAQDFSGQPECAVNCLREFIPQAGCALGDAECLCRPSSQTALQPLIAPCLIANCGADELGQAINASDAACEAVKDGGGASDVTTVVNLPVTGVSTSATRTTVLASSTSTSSTSASSPTDAPSETPSSPSSPGLNPAAIGLGVGIGVGGLLIILLALFLFRRHRKRRTSPAPDLSPAPPPSQGKAELPNSYITGKPPDDDPTHGRAEAPPHETRYEIPTNEGIQGRHELGSNDSWHQRHP